MSARVPPRSLAVTVVELVRPLALLAVFVGVDVRFGAIWAAPFALGAFLSAAVLVHDLIHNAHALPRRMNEIALGFYALLLVKSGHGLRRLHLEHHARCLEDDDREGNVVYVATWRLLLTGPWLALQARGLSYRADPAHRGLQRFETALDVALTAALLYPWWRSGEYGPIVYLAIVFVNTVSIPVIGVKLPHLLPERAPGLVRFLRRWTTRLTPAASAILFHELHHRRPRIPAALLPENAGLLATTSPSPCVPQREARLLP